MEAAYRGKRWSEFEIGETATTAGRTITEADVATFGCLTGDWNPLHMDADFAARSPYGKRIVHGALGQSLMVGMTAQLGIFEGTTLALRSMDTTFKRPMFFGDTVYVRIRVENKKKLRDEGQGLVQFKAELYNQEDQLLIVSEWTALMKND